MQANFKLRGTLIAVAGVLALGAVAPAMADNNDDIVYTLMAKGVLTEEEGHQLLNGRDKEREKEQKSMKSAGKLKIADAIDNISLYGDIRVRAEKRDGSDMAATVLNETRDRMRYKITLGAKTEAGDFYSDLALAMGSGGRSDNATFGSGANGSDNKEILYVKRAMVGWKVTDWMTVEGGRMANPLYTTSMVWDGDLSFEGLNEQFKYKMGDVDLFANLVQSQYQGDHKVFSGATGSTSTFDNFILAFQGGAKAKFTDSLDGKAAFTYYKYTNARNDLFSPSVGTSASTTGVGTAGSITGTNNLSIIEIPAEINFKGSDTMKYSLFEDFAVNTDSSKRQETAVAQTAALAGLSNDDTAWMVGAGVKYQAGKKAAAGDMSAKVWYQDVGVYSLDPNTVDSDFMDSRLNMKGVVFKGEYLLRDNVFVNFAYGHADRKNTQYGAAGSGDIAANINKFNLYQLDLTYKF